MDKTKDLVSVFIITRNRAGLLRRAVISVLEQTYKNIELIVVDDNSELSSEMDVREVIAKSGRKLVLTFIYNKKQSGACYSRNKAIENCRGKYITGLDDDDYFSPRRISRFLNDYNERYAFLCSPMEVCVKDKKFVVNTKPKVVSLDNILFRNSVGNQIFALASRYKNIGGYDENLPALQDHDMWTRMIEQYGPAYRVDSATICIDKTHAKRITTGSQKLEGYRRWYKKHVNKMSEKHKEAYHVMVSLSSGNVKISQLVKCKYMHNKLRIAKCLLIQCLPKYSKAMYR